MTDVHEILDATTTMLRKGDAVTRENTNGVEVVNVYAMPHVSEAADGMERVDVHFIEVGVDKQSAEAHRAELIEWLDSGYLDGARLAGSPSYIEIGGALGSQDAALRLFALGQALDLWHVITPAIFGIDGAAADELAGRGFVGAAHRRGGSQALRRGSTPESVGIGGMVLVVRDARIRRLDQAARTSRRRHGGMHVHPSAARPRHRAGRDQLRRDADPEVGIVRASRRDGRGAARA